ncbi:MAG: DNA cytosine methyltransferase [Bacteroidales bacterium]|nr:DNA cytosine methyltransferase [Bacteroidales bacterium]
MSKIPVIDLFAGPGGLGEGFSSVKDEKGNFVFDIKLSIEKDETAHKTLTLRSFYRQFLKTGHIVPKKYYEALRVNDVRKREETIEELYRKYSDESSNAKEEVQKIELGNSDFPNFYVDNKIRKALKREKDWILIGGPPCQAYSLAGRSRVGGVKEDDKRVYLYREYLRIIAVHHPSVFVMENVKGMLSAKVEGTRIFEWIKQDLKNPGILFPGNDSPKYRIYSFANTPVSFDSKNNPGYKTDQDYLIKAEKYGIPQKRHRVILYGIREDINGPLEILEAKDKVFLKSVIGLILPTRSFIGGRKMASK